MKYVFPFLVVVLAAVFSTPANTTSPWSSDWGRMWDAHERSQHGALAKKAVKRSKKQATRKVVTGDIYYRPCKDCPKSYSVGQDIAYAMAADMGKNLRSAYRGLAYCGLYLGTIVQRMGYKPPPGHALARNWRHFGSPAHGPAPGVIMVSRNHVAVVTRVNGNGTVTIRGGNQAGGRVNDITVHTGRAIAWRRPS